MTALEQLDAVQAEIRRAVAAGSYVEARALLSRHGVCLEAAVCSLTPDNKCLLEIREQTNCFFEWVRRMALAGRTHAAQEAQRLPQLSRYRTPDTARSSPRLQLEG